MDEGATGRRAFGNHPFTSLIFWGLCALFLLGGLVEIGLDLWGLLDFSGWRFDDQYALVVSPSEKPLHWTLSLIAGASSVACALLLLFGSHRRHLHLALLCLWIWLPTRYLLLFLWHLASSWYRDVGIYDQGAWISAIINAVMTALLLSAVLYGPGPMRRRFPKPGEDIAAIF
jgi:hypothetical protein